MRALMSLLVCFALSSGMVHAQQATTPPVSSPPVSTPSISLPSPGSLVTSPASPNPLVQPTPAEPKVETGQPPGTLVPQGQDQQKTPEVGGPIDIVLAPKPVLMQLGQSTWDDGYENLMEVFARLNAEAGRLKLKVIGRPKAAFLSTDDQGFRYEAMLELETEPATPLIGIGKDFAVSKSASGKALKFTHSGAYDDIDTTYEAITAYLDEKGAKARNIFIEEYLKDTKSSEDTAFEMNIYVLIE